VILHGDCRQQLATLEDCSVDSIVTDPPYELGFMGKKWDASGIAYDRSVWTECLRVLKPGGHLLAFGGTRTYHRMTVAIEDAGFEIRDSLHWLYGSGFPKSLDVSKAIDKALGADRIDVYADTPKAMDNTVYGKGLGVGVIKRNPATPAAAAAAGWGTALKPAHEPIVLARKPLVGTVAANVMAYGTGALNIDGCRIAGADTTTRHNSSSSSYMTGTIGTVQPVVESYTTGSAAGRWPANLILTHSPDCNTECAAGCPVAALNTQSGNSTSNVRPPTGKDDRGQPGFVMRRADTSQRGHADAGGASRFFTTTEWDPEIDVPFLYVAKPSRRERDAGLSHLPSSARPTMGDGIGGQPNQQAENNKNIHPTVKPVALMRHLIRLVTPPGGTVLDPFLGSGTTAVAATLEGFDWVGCELTDDYLPIIEARVAWAEQHQPEPDLTLFNDAQ
jgi:DNA modification methylase